MGAQELTLQMALIVAAGVFLASFTDAIAGGGGIISVPSYLLAGLPAHFALGTNKLSAGLGSIASTGRFIKNGFVDWKKVIEKAEKIGVKHYVVEQDANFADGNAFHSIKTSADYLKQFMH